MNIELRPLPFQVSLAPADLGALLDKHGTPSPHSLRKSLGYSPGLSADGTERAISAGLIDRATGKLTAEGETVADVLLAPATIISLEYRDFNGYAGRLSAQFPDTPAAGAGVVVNRDGESWHVSGFVDDTALSALVGFVPGSGSGQGMPEFEAVLTFAQAAVLCTVLDLQAGEIEAEAGRENAGLSSARNGQSPFTSRRVADYLDIWWGTAPATRLLGQVFALALNPDPPAEAVIATVLDDLAKAGLLAAAGDAWLPTEMTFDLARAATRIEASLFWERLRLDPLGERQPEGAVKRYLIGDRGTNFSFELLGETTLRLRTENAADYAGFFASELAGPRHQPRETAHFPRPLKSATEESAPAQSGTPPHNFCEQCGNRLSPGDKFCTACGARVGGN